MPDQSTSAGEPWTDRLERFACFSDASLAAHLERLKTRRAVSLKILCGSILDDLCAAAGELDFRRAEYEAGKPKARVYQEFDYCGVVPAGHPVDELGAWFASRLRGALGRMSEPPIAADFTVNDTVCQRYRRGDLGITPHRDHIAYTQLITLVVLGGRGRYFVCADRQGHGRREINAEPGRAILMPGPGYAGRSDRPFHLVGDIESLRYSVGLRHDARKAGEHTTGEGRVPGPRNAYPQIL